MSIIEDWAGCAGVMCTSFISLLGRADKAICFNSAGGVALLQQDSHGPDNKACPALSYKR